MSQVFTNISQFISLYATYFLGSVTLAALFFIVPSLFRIIRTAWHMYRIKKAGADYFKYMNDFFSNLPPREITLCKDCKHSEVSTNNGNLICLYGHSRYFGRAVDPDGDKRDMCFERKEQPNEVNTAN
jgi:hypothetical protein